MIVSYSVVVEAGYVKVKRNGAVICAAVDTGSKNLRDISFLHPKDQKCNKTRQAAMRAYQSAGYR